MWMLKINTSLPEVCRSESDLEEVLKKFETFEEGKAAMLEAIRGFATNDNAMFDGNGHLINLYEWNKGKNLSEHKGIMVAI